MNLYSLQPPYFHLVVGSEDEFGKYAFKLNYEMNCTKPCQFAVRVVRGKKMKTRNGFFDEFASAFQFPDYFGENWAALDECLSDLEWIPAEGYVVLMPQAASLLSDEDREDRTIAVRLLDRVCKYWATERRVFPSRELKLLPYHVVFHATESHAEFVREFLLPEYPGMPLLLLTDMQRDQKR
jgi:RNAse (barnase) inhibitor barstar